MSKPIAKVSSSSANIFLGYTLLIVAYLSVTLGIAHHTLYLQDLVLVAAVFAILALSLDLVAGVTGLYSLGHAGLFAIGAYGSTLLNSKLGWNIFLVLPICIIGVGLIGIILGSLSLRVSGLYFAITTFIFTLVVVVVISDSNFTGGLQGIAGPAFPDLPSWLRFIGEPVTWMASLGLLGTITVIWSIRNSKFYPVLLAIRDAEPFAAAAGVRTSVMKVAIFGLSSALAGLAGWIFSFLGFISPGQFGWTVSVNILVMVILGGINTKMGPIIGAIFVSVFPVIVNINPFWQEVLFGIIFVFVIVVFPEGFMGIISGLGRRLRKNKTFAASRVESSRNLEDEKKWHLPKVDNSTEDALICKNITFGYISGTLALKNVDFVVRRGTIHGLIGPNGSGKSTLVNLISGQISPIIGSIEVNGQMVGNLPAHQRSRRGLMRTFQTAVLIKELSVKENVALGLYSRVPRIATRGALWPMIPSARRDGKKMDSYALASLAQSGLEENWSSRRIADVPHGVEQLTQLAAAFVGKPSILILDEPLAGLSSGEIEKVSNILLHLKASGVTIVVVEHQTKFIFDVCDEVTVLAAGELIKTGKAQEVRADVRVREVYLGQ
ncbi:MAG TPA: ATP-binding cassette domain-containing protein [Candidatus Nanopelagicaceae bacterium]